MYLFFIIYAELSNNYKYSNKYLSKNYLYLCQAIQICTMETSIRGYLLKEIVQSNDFFSVYNAEHAILKGQELRITVLKKEIADDSKIRSAFNQSIFKLAFVEHPNISRNIDMLEENDKLVVLSEKEDYTLLQDFVFKYSVDTKLTICEKVLNAVIYLNSRNIYVTDLNPDCVVINHERQPKIINAGLINIFFNTDNEEINNTLKNHLSFSAPEILDNPKNICEKSDVFTCALFIRYIFGNGDIIDDHHDLSNTPIYLHNLLLQGLSEKPEKRQKNVIDLLKELNNTVCSNTQISGSINENPENQTESAFSVDVKTGLPEIEDIVTNKIDFDIDKAVQEIDSNTASIPIVNQNTNNQNTPKSDAKTKSMNYYDVLAALEAEKKAQANDEIQKKSQKVADPHVRSSSYVPKADPESKSAKFTAKKEENRVSQHQSQSYNKPPQQESNTNYQTRSQQQSQPYNQPPQQSSNINYQTRSQQQNTYSQHQPPSVSVNTAGIVVLGFLGIVFSFALPLVGFILAIIGLSQLPKQKQKLVAIKRDFSQSEKTNRTIGTIFSIIALVVSVIRMLIFVVNIVS